MGNIGDPITPSVPVVGSAGPQFAADINAILNEAVARLSTKVPLASVNFNASLDLSGSDLLNVSNIVFSNLVGAPSGSPFSRLATFGGNLYFVNAAGAVQITTGASLNAAALAGITGDYGGANPAQLNYIAVDTRYNFYANFGTGTWAYARVLGLDIAGGATSTAFARLLWGGSSNVTFTLPSVMPAGNAILTIDNTGAIAASTNTTPAANSNIVLSGTGTYKHGLKTICRTIFSNAANTQGLTDHLNNNFTAFIGLVLALSGGGNDATGNVSLPLIPTHSRIVNVTVTFDSAASRNACTGQVKKTGGGDPASVTPSNVGGAMSNTGTAKLTVTGLNVTPASGEGFWAQITNTSGAVNPKIVNIIVDYDTV